MICARSLSLAFAAIVLAQYPGLARAQAAGLRHDVFGRPALENPQHARTVPGQTDAVEDTAPPWNPELRAVIVAGRNSLANVDGALVRIGGEIDGYRLTEVREREAVFVKGKKRHTLALRGIREPDAARDAQTTGAARGMGAAPAAAGVKSPGVLPEAPAAGGTPGSDTSTRGSQ